MSHFTELESRLTHRTHLLRRAGGTVLAISWLEYKSITTFHSMLLNSWPVKLPHTDWQEENTAQAARAILLSPAEK